MQIDGHQNINEGIFLCISIQNCRLEVANPFLEGVDLRFEGCQFAFWRLKLSWGVLYRKGVIPKKGGTLGSREMS